jgi:hypothetical protein
MGGRLLGQQGLPEGLFTMKQLGKLLIALVLFAISVGMVGAQDEPLANDPNVNPDANACFAGGSMEGKCADSEYLWTGAWYKIRFDFGLISRAVFPDQYRWMLPEVETVVQTWPAAGCYWSDPYGLYIIWKGNQTQTPIEMTWDVSNCSTPTTGVGGFLFVSTPDAASAASLCTAQGYIFIDEVSSASNTKAWPIYRCQM